ncbi:aldo/keto reductase [Natronorubrum aibiense]|uniref:Aldo/keto reductase n=1 Tax=Natronorubrum aibiense TaxID=348826 RepID=A0A5P9NZV5_9EURY|nr:aldo/keto reductase [Natronorubrum aibiense]QFU81425.1 aldo/keto reductase [Natronorubrum aibiense]
MEAVSIRSVDVPALGLGTWPMRGDACTQAVTTALELGYRHVDTAQMYDNEDAVGRAIADSSVDRDDVFVTTKLLRENLRRDDALESFRRSLDRLEMEYVDLLLIHAPNPSVPIEETIRVMNRLQDEGSVRQIGVSNFSIEQVQEAMTASETPILTNQVLYHPYRDRSAMLEFCRDNELVLTAYSPLGEGSIATDETLAEIGATYDKTAAQVALRWLLQQETVSAIPKASSQEHLRENIDIFDFELTDAEMDHIFAL